VFPRRYQGLLGDVLRVVMVTKAQGNAVGHRGMPLHEHLVGIQGAFLGAGNLVAVPGRRPGLHLRPAISSYLWCRASVPQPATEHAVTVGARPEGLSRHPADTAEKMDEKCCDDLPGAVSN